MDKAIREAVFERANGDCECGCGDGVTPEFGRCDHFFGRAKVVEAIDNCWALTVKCDEAKTANRPSARYWLEKFIVHARKHGYDMEAVRAENKVAVLIQKGLA